MDIFERGALISQGAEGKVYESKFLSKPSVEKVRVSKRYRVPELDQKLNKQRILQECRCMVKCMKAGVLTPNIYHIDIASNRIIIEKIIGATAKDFFNSYKDTGYNEKECSDIATKIGEIIGKMHDNDIIHGDLTTSNIMIRNESKEIVMIDFGLGSTQSIIEDKAVDLYVLERAMLSTHPGSQHLINFILASYRFACKKHGTLVLFKLEQVRLRGRKRDMIG